MSGLPQIGLIGLSHRQAPVEMLERLAFPGERLGQALHGWHRGGGEGVILFTCNRVELYFAGQDDLTPRARHFLAHFHGISPQELEPHLVARRDEGAARHLFRVACGLDSMVQGETEILGQVRQAYHAALGEGSAGPVLSGLFRKALQVGKRARWETGLGRRPSSMGSVAVRLLQEVRGSLEGVPTLLIGTGEMAELAGKHLQAAGARLEVASRTLGRALGLSEELGGRPVDRDGLAGALARAEVVVAATSAHHHVVTPPMLPPGREMVLLDMALPRNVDPAVGAAPGVRLLDIDDLRSVLDAQTESFERALARAETLVEEEARSFSRWLHARRMAPLIAQLRQRAEGIRRAELERALARLPDLDEEQRQVLRAMSQAIVNKLLHEPVVRLKDEAAAGNGEQVGALLAGLFGLGDGAQAAPAEPGRPERPRRSRG